MSVLFVDLIDLDTRHNTDGKISVNLKEHHIEIHMIGNADVDIHDEGLGIDIQEEANYNCYQCIKRTYIDLIEADYKHISKVWIVDIHTLGNARTEEFIFNDERKWLKFYNELTNWWLQTP